METDKEIAIKILSCLCESSFVNDLQDYRKCIQNDLNLSDEKMEEIFNLKYMINLILPKKYYKGQPIFKLQNLDCIFKKPLTPLSPLTDDDDDDDDK
jgi:hypothetical protein